MIKIDSGAASLIGATLAFLGVIVASTAAQWGAANLEDRRARTELVIELMKANDREETLQKLRILNASGLLPDDNGRLIDAVTAAPPVAFKLQEVKVPIAVSCVDPKDIPPEIPPMNERWPQEGSLKQKVLRLGIQGLELRSQNELFRAMLVTCSKDLPPEGDVKGGLQKPHTPAGAGAKDGSRLQ